MTLRAKTLPQLITVEREQHDWIPGALFALLLAVLAGFLDEADQRITAKAQEIATLERANAALARERSAQDAKTRVELSTPDGERFECKQMHIRAIWSEAVGRKCGELGELLQHARKIP